MQDILERENLNIVLYSNDEKINYLWSRAFSDWISNYKSASTIRSYKDGWRFFLNFCHLPPWKVGRSIVVEWINSMKESGLSDATIQLRLSAISSFYVFVNRDFTVINEQGREIPLFDINPGSSRILRKRVKPYSKSNYLSKDEIKKFLGAMKRETIQGSRDYALFISYILTGRRNSEIRNLKWGDIEIADDGAVLYWWHGKNVESKRAEMPRPAFEAIKEYLNISKRSETISKDEYIFVKTNDNANRLPVVQRSQSKKIVMYESHPLTMREVGKLMRKYCKLAGIEKYLTCHSLRHSAVVLRQNVGESIEEISTFLNHANFHTTNVYLHALTGTRDKNWKKVTKILDL